MAGCLGRLMGSVLHWAMLFVIIFSSLAQIFIANVNKAVSYTHLDVYKRQGMGY